MPKGSKVKLNSGDEIYLVRAKDGEVPIAGFVFTAISATEQAVDSGGDSAAIQLVISPSRLAEICIGRLHATMKHCCYNAVTEKLIAAQMAGLDANESADVESKEDESGLRIALKKCLQANNRAGSDAQSLRKLLGAICKYANEETMNKLEHCWQGVIADTVKELILTDMQDNKADLFAAAEDVKPSTSSRSEFATIEELKSILQSARRITSVELADASVCALSADDAFEKVYRLLSPQAATRVAQALAVCISSLLDATRQAAVPPKKWRRDFEELSELIKVSIVTNQSVANDNVIFLYILKHG